MTIAKVQRHELISFALYYSQMKKERDMTKKDACLEFLKRFGYITPRLAYNAFDSMRLAVIISDLRKEGHDIVTTYPETMPRYAIYILNEEGETNDNSESN